MKNLKKYIVFIGYALMVFSLNSCLFSEDEVFDEPAAQRLNHAVEEALTILESADNGWIMEYFPNNEMEGYTFLMKFYPDGKTDIASKNKYTPSYTVGSGCWEIIRDNGPVLTFNTFVKNFHLFSDPRNPGQSGYNGVGLEGDYEFIVLNVEDNLVKLKGKKRGTDIVLKRMDQAQEWKSYFTKLESIDDFLFNKRVSVDWYLTFNKSIYRFKNGSSHIFTATPLIEEPEKQKDNSDEQDPDFNIPFIITDYGIRLAQPLEVDDFSVQSFRISNDNRYLYADENSEVKIEGPSDLAEYLINNQIVWRIDEDKFPVSLKPLFERVKQSCIDVYSAEQVFLSFAYSTTLRSYSLRLTFIRNSGKQTIEGNFGLETTYAEKNKITFSYSKNNDANGTTFISRIDGLEEMIGVISKIYDLSTNSPLQMTDLKFSANDILFETTRIIN